VAKYIVNGAVTGMLLRAGLKYYAGQEAPDNIPERDLKSLLESKVLIPAPVETKPFAPATVVEFKPAVVSPTITRVVEAAVQTNDDGKPRKKGV